MQHDPGWTNYTVAANETVSLAVDYRDLLDAKYQNGSSYVE